MKKRIMLLVIMSLLAACSPKAQSPDPTAGMPGYRIGEVTDESGAAPSGGTDRTVAMRSALSAALQAEQMENSAASLILNTHIVIYVPGNALADSMTGNMSTALITETTVTDSKGTVVTTIPVDGRTVHGTYGDPYRANAAGIVDMLKKLRLDTAAAD